MLQNNEDNDTRVYLAQQNIEDEVQIYGKLPKAENMEIGGEKYKGITHYGIMWYKIIYIDSIKFIRYYCLFASKDKDEVIECLDKIVIRNANRKMRYIFYTIENMDPNFVSPNILKYLGRKYVRIQVNKTKFKMAKKNNFDIQIKENLNLYNEYVDFCKNISNMDYETLKKEYETTFNKKLNIKIFKAYRMRHKIIDVKVDQLKK